MQTASFKLCHRQDSRRKQMEQMSNHIIFLFLVLKYSSKYKPNKHNLHAEHMHDMHRLHEPFIYMINIGLQYLAPNTRRMGTGTRE